MSAPDLDRLDALYRIATQPLSSLTVEITDAIDAADELEQVYPALSAELRALRAVYDEAKYYMDTGAGEAKVRLRAAIKAAEDLHSGR